MKHVTDIPSEYQQALGAIAVGVAHLEGAMTVCINRLTTPEDYKITLCLVGGESFEILINKLDKVFRHKVSNTKLLDRFDDLKNKLSKINEKRNEYIHAAWYRGPDWLQKENEIYRMKTKKRMSSVGELADSKLVPLGTLTQLATETARALDELYEFIYSNVEEIEKQYNAT